MKTKDFIKVSQKESDNFTVVPAVNADYYKSQGFVVEEPTKAEVAMFFPESNLPPTPLKGELKMDSSALLAELETVRGEKATLETKVAELETVKGELEAQMEELTKKIEVKK